MRSLKLLAFCILLAAAANSFLGPVRAQAPGGQVADLKAAADAIAALADQQKTISDNHDKIDAKLADIAENVRVGRLYAKRVR